MSAPALDPSVIDALRQLTPAGEPDVVVEVLRLFRDDAPGRIASIRHAAATASAEQVQRAAHEFKGACGTIGATGLQQCCRDLELAAKAGGLGQLDQLLAALDTEWARVEAAIAGYLAGRSGVDMIEGC